MRFARKILSLASFATVGKMLPKREKLPKKIQKFSIPKNRRYHGSHNNVYRRQLLSDTPQFGCNINKNNNRSIHNTHNNNTNTRIIIINEQQQQQQHPKRSRCDDQENKSGQGVRSFLDHKEASIATTRC